MLTYFIRHGQSINNAKGLVSGSFDCPLTEKGVEQAETTAKILRTQGITKIISSPLKRAKHTAEIVGQSLNLAVEVQEDLKEVNYGDCEDQPCPNDCQTNLEMIAKNTCSNAETIADIHARAERVVSFLKEVGSNETILIVGHGTFTAMVFAVAEGRNAEELLPYRLTWTFDNAEVKKLSL